MLGRTLVGEAEVRNVVVMLGGQRGRNVRLTASLRLGWRSVLIVLFVCIIFGCMILYTLFGCFSVANCPMHLSLLMHCVNAVYGMCGLANVTLYAFMCYILFIMMLDKSILSMCRPLFTYFIGTVWLSLVLTIVVLLLEIMHIVWNWFLRRPWLYRMLFCMVSVPIRIGFVIGCPLTVAMLKCLVLGCSVRMMYIRLSWGTGVLQRWCFCL